LTLIDAVEQSELKYDGGNGMARPTG